MGKQRLINFLNSILYPNIKEKKIMDINKISNKITNLKYNGSNNHIEIQFNNINDRKTFNVCLKFL